MARLAVKINILRDLALRSRNQCAYPGCSNSLINEDDVFIGQICHIEAAEKGGPRYNSNQTDEERRAYDNLLFLCYEHHTVTHDAKKYPVDLLRKIKTDHESEYVDGSYENRIGHAIEQLQRTQQKLVANLENLLNNGEKGKDAPEYEGDHISTSEDDEIWLPEQGKLYRDNWHDGSQVEYLMKGDVLCVNHILPDGAVAYYEIAEDGSVRETRLPYPIEEYSVEIPEDMLVRTDVAVLPNGSIRETHVLKFRRSVTLLKDTGGKLLEIDVQARSRISHQDRLFRILGTRD